MALTYDYLPAVLYAIDAISQGRTVTSACDEANIGIATFERYIKQSPELQELFAEAERRSHDAMADALVEIDNHRVHGQSDPKMAKVISDNIKWLLSKRDTKRFGDRLEVKHEVTFDRAITEALDQARTRVNSAPRMIEDAQYTIVNAVPEVDTAQSDDEIMQELFR